MDPRALDVGALRGSSWLERSREFARGLGRPGQTAGGLVVVGTPEDEPWHFTAHLADEARWSGRPELTPTLVRWSPPPGAPPHLAIGLERLAEAGRGQTLVVSAPGTPSERLLDRVDDVRRRGGTVLALGEDADLCALAHDSLTIPSTLVTHDLAEHLVSLAAGEPSGTGGERTGAVSTFLRRLARQR